MMRSAVLCLALFVAAVLAQPPFQDPSQFPGGGPQGPPENPGRDFGQAQGLQNPPGTKLITSKTETPRQREQRLKGEIPDAEPGEEPNVAEIYNPMEDAKCFNQPYDTSSVENSRSSLYSDYVNIFEWGFNMPQTSPIFALSEENNGVTNNRFPGMCLRMSFHDNSIQPRFGEYQSFISSQIDPSGKWIGPGRFLPTSGGDASVLTCRIERLHPNQNYDQTASRILFAFQTTIVPGLGGQSLMEKYKMSYADALHNCAQAAMNFLSPSQAGDASSRFRFGRKDACYFSDDPVLAAEELSANGNNPLCGPTELLPPVTFNAKESNRWFTSRGMNEGTWLSLMGTHTTFDNFGRTDVLRTLPVAGDDYFANYVGVPIHIPDVREANDDPEKPGCTWIVDGIERFWPMSHADCALGIDVVDDTGNLRQLESVMQRYISSPTSWIPNDLICALTHLGGIQSEQCGGNDSLFGSIYS